MNVDDYAALRLLIREEEGLLSHCDVFSCQPCVKNADFDYFRRRSGCLDQVSLKTHDNYVAWHVTEAWDNSINRGAVWSHRDTVSAQRHSKDWTNIRDRNVREGDGARQSEPYGSRPNCLDQHLRMSNFVCSNFLSDSRFISLLIASPLRTVRTVTLAVSKSFALLAAPRRVREFIEKAYRTDNIAFCAEASNGAIWQ